MCNKMFKINLVLLTICAMALVEAIDYPSIFSASDCLAPHTEGDIDCKAYILRYHWNDATKQCEEVIWGGCRPTNNNFQTLEDCEETAGPICA
ncbi:kappaPI-actitoxin-Avd3b-like [Rhynchophorus ferrugineus]|uniref:kappaPI-actitoxin-Avd3b-like n=1 Tax=Rhynchophorus ferrugineus TaxID=354439 RepID=UPI003FCDD0CF